MQTAPDQDAVVIGGGFYGAAIAVYLARERGLKRIVLVESEDALLTRASYRNQARVHNGYHYPRSFTTAYRSRINLARFIKDWPAAVSRDFTALYAIARRNSKVTARQFERFCGDIGAILRPADTALTALFEPRLIEAVYAVEEYAFDATVLAAWARDTLQALGVDLRLQTRATAILPASEGLQVLVQGRDDTAQQAISCRYVFNCTYSGLNQFAAHGPAAGTSERPDGGLSTNLKHELTEMALIALPAPLRGLGVTVMDGPFFSVMPFPARGLHTLSHVRYTPHLHWEDQPGIDPYRKLAEYTPVSRVDRMLRDVERYLPSIRQAEYVESSFEVKTVLVKNESDDGRPILLEKHAALPGCFSVLGGKIDNIYDVIEILDAEPFVSPAH